MQHNPILNFQLLTDYLAKECSPEQAAVVERWLKEHPGREQVLQNIRGVWNEVPRHLARTVDIDRAARVIEAYASAHPVNDISQKDGVGRSDKRVLLNAPSIGRAFTAHGKRLRWTFMSVFGCAALIAGALFLNKRPSGENELPLISYPQYVTGNGHHARIPLADGSVVILSNASTLTVDPDFGRSERRVTMTGEAHFTVTASRDRPFIVEAGNTVTRVLGTTFTVRKYAEDSATRVVVTEGKVSIRAEQPLGTRALASEAILVAHAMGQVSDSGQIFVNPRVPIDGYTGWLTGQLVFRETPLKDAIRELERAYDVEIRVTDTLLLTRRITLSTSVAAKSIDDVLNLVSPVVEVRYVRAGRFITLTP